MKFNVTGNSDPGTLVSAPMTNRNGVRATTATLQSVYRNPVVWLISLSLLWASNAFAGSLPNFSALIEEEGDAVVKISVVTGVTASTESQGFDLDRLPESQRRFFEQFPQFQDPTPRRGQGFGSGFITSQDGYIITNAHVVDNATEITVSLIDRREYTAELIGMDKPSDIALLKVDATDLPVVQLGNSDDVKVGEWVLAIGSPFGFEYSATQGIVSAVARNLPADTYVPFIQTDVAVNPGNSGGPLFNTDGQVVGVNSQIYSRSGGYQGLSFAIPINVATNIADQLKAKGYASRGWLGVMIQDVDQALAESFGLDKPEGALIADVTNASPAEKAGLKQGDIIVKFNDTPVTHSGKLPPMVGAVPVGSTVPVTVLRDGDEKVIDVTIAELESDRREIQVSDSSQGDLLGLTVQGLTADLADSLGVTSGVVITEVAAGSPAQEAGLQPGDVVVTLNRKDVDDVASFEALVQSLPTGKSFPVLVQRDGSSVFRAIRIPASNE